MGRLRALQDLRRKRQSERRPVGNVNMVANEADNSGKRVCLANNISKSYENHQVVIDFSIRIARGDRIGIIGPNGAGKTTTIGKLAKRLQDEGKRVMLAAGDTFRAAAVEQLQVWGERNNVPVISQQAGADPAAVVYDAYQAAKSRGIDVLLADTAGRLQNQQGLMDELAKIKRVVARHHEGAPQEVME